MTIENEEQFMLACWNARTLESKLLLLDTGREIVPFPNITRDALTERIGLLKAQMDEFDSAHNGDRKGAWTVIGTGRRFWFEDPRPEDFFIEDIAHSLSRINRYNGQLKCPNYSVAQHSVLVSNILPPHLQLYGLMHDASEAYIQDIIRPLKKLIKACYQPIEDRVMKAIAERFDFDIDNVEYNRLVKEADDIILVTEMRDVTLYGVCGPRPRGQLPLEEKITPWSPDLAKQEFLSRFQEIEDGRRPVFKANLSV